MSEKDYKPVKTSKVGGSPFTGVLGWIDNRSTSSKNFVKRVYCFSSA